MVKVYEYRDTQHAYWEVIGEDSTEPMYSTDNIFNIVRYLTDNELEFELIGKMVKTDD